MVYRAQKLLTRYLDSWWLPATLFFALAGTLVFSVLQHMWPPLILIKAPSPFVLHLILWTTPLAFAGLLSAAIWNAKKGHWAKAIPSILIVVSTISVAYLLYFGSHFLDPGKDEFAAGLEIPKDLEVSEPSNDFRLHEGPDKDAFQTALLAALLAEGSNDPTVAGTVSPLLRHHDYQSILTRYLASSPAWRVFEERGKMFATRRWKIGAEWRHNLHGYYSDFDFDRLTDTSPPRFQSRVTIGLSGKPWFRGNENTTWLKPEETVSARLTTRDRLQESHYVISANPAVVEVFEQSILRERRLTKAALKFLNNELAPLVETPSWETIRSILPAGSISHGQPTIRLRQSSQPGIYDSFIWLNPGEPGTVYLKAFEVTTDTLLSAVRVKERTNERVGWSERPEELFFLNAQFTIYEGDWGDPYAARFEVWFSPDSGAPDRKLIEKIYRIEGWQR